MKFDNFPEFQNIISDRQSDCKNYIRPKPSFCRDIIVDLIKITEKYAEAQIYIYIYIYIYTYGFSLEKQKVEVIFFFIKTLKS